ncbi:hypothetical protein D3C80_1438760 [compost metagenome]
MIIIIAGLLLLLPCLLRFKPVYTSNFLDLCMQGATNRFNQIIMHLFVHRTQAIILISVFNLVNRLDNDALKPGFFLNFP